MGDEAHDLVIATGRYHGGLVPKSGLLPIGCTTGSAKFLNYELAANVGLLAPYGCRVHDHDKEAFRAAYRARLDQFGVDAIEAVLGSIAAAYGAEGIVLLCFEDVLCTDEWCHRRMFAEWWEEQTGQAVPEIAPAQTSAIEFDGVLLPVGGEHSVRA